MNRETVEKEINEALTNAKPDRNVEGIIDGINALPHTIESGDYYYIPYVLRLDHETTFPDSYIALYGRKTKYGISTKDYLFLVASSSATEIVGKFLAVFQELSKRKFVRNRQWVCPYKCLKLLISFKDIELSKWLNKM